MNDKYIQTTIELIAVGCIAGGAFIHSVQAGLITTGAVLVVAAMLRRII